MASGLSSPLGVFGIILIIIGIVMVVVGIIFLISLANETKPWWTWFLLIGGIVFGIIGGILLAIALSQAAVVVATAPVVVTPQPTMCAAPQPQVIYANPPPVVTPQPTMCGAQQMVYTNPQPQVVYTNPQPQVVYTNPQPQMVYANPQPVYRQNPQYVAPRQVAAPIGVPVDHVGTTVQAYGQERFDPDPIHTSTYSPPSPRRQVAVGPYGPGGQNISVPGTYTPQGTITTTTYDIGDHSVVSSAPVQGQRIGQQNVPQVMVQAPPRNYQVQAR